MNLDDFQPVINSIQDANTKTVSLEFLFKIWKINNEKARNVLDHST